MGIEQLVNVIISPAQGSILQTSFGTPLILSTEATFPERLRYYTALSGLTSDGFTTTGATYLMASRIFSQTPRPRRVAVGRRANKPTQRFALVPTAANSTLYSFEVGVAGVTATVSYTSDSSATVAEIVGGLVAAFAAISGPPAVAVTNVGPDTSVRVVANTAGAFITLKNLTPKVLSITQDNVDAGVAADLAAIYAEQPDWYGVVTPFSGQAEVAAIAAWVEANKRLFAVTTVDSSNWDTAYDATDVTPDLGTALRLAGYSRTFFTGAFSTAEFTMEGALGYLLGTTPGQATLHLKRVAGASAMALTATQQANLEARHGNPYITVAGLNVIMNGVVAVGEFADKVRDIDWFVSDTATEVFAVLAGADKIPYTDDGIAIIRTVLAGQARKGIERGVLAGSPTPIITAPKAAEVSSVDKANRVLPDVTLTATIAGAIHKVDPLNITVSV